MATTTRKAAAPARRAPVRRRLRKKNNVGGMLLLVLALVGVAIGGVVIAQAAQENKQMRTALDRTTFFDGIYVEDVHLGGMTYDQAQTTLSRILGAREFDGSVIITYGEQIWEATSDMLAVDFDLDQVLTQAYAIGRSGQTDQDNYQAVQQLKTVPARFDVSAQLGAGGLSDLAADIAAQIDKPAKNAAFMGFGNGVQFSKEEPGLAVDQQLLTQRILERIQSGDLSAAVEVPTTVLEPQITVAQLESTYKRIARYTSKATSDKTRNSNIKLALSAINGTVVGPDETFSMNGTTGERTDAKGYQPAGAIRNGVLIQELGGGVCQVSTALFNAVARADLSIVERNPHTWPSSYVEKGQDAMVDYPGSDFKFKNNTGADLYLCCWFDDASHTIYVELYGVPVLEQGVTIELRTEVLETISQPEDIVEESSALPQGSVEETRTGRTGYRVRCYKQYMKDGQLLREEKLCDSYYAALAAIFTVGTALAQTPDQTQAPVDPQIPIDTSEPLG